MTTQRDTPSLPVAETLSRFPTNVTAVFEGAWTSRACTTDEIDLAKST
jgi:hypothetical protein